MTKNKHLMPLKVVGASNLEIIGHAFSGTVTTETLGTCQRSICIDIGQTEHSIMQMTMTDYMWEVNT